MRISLFLNFCEKFFKDCWWVLFFILICYFGYEQGLKQRDQDFAKLYRQYLELQKEKKTAQVLQEDLFLQINSQSDPAWVELTLMKVLGLVPEEQVKAIFTPLPKE